MGDIRRQSGTRRTLRVAVVVLGFCAGLGFAQGVAVGAGADGGDLGEVSGSAVPAEQSRHQTSGENGLPPAREPEEEATARSGDRDDGGALATQAAVTAAAEPPDDGPAVDAPVGGAPAGASGEPGADAATAADGHARDVEQAAPDPGQADDLEQPGPGADGAAPDPGGTGAVAEPADDADGVDAQDGDAEPVGEQAADADAGGGTTIVHGDTGHDTAVGQTVSDGATSVSTGTATATGTDSATQVTQVVGARVSDSGKVLIDQVIISVNIGVGYATSGGNAAAGNHVAVGGGGPAGNSSAEGSVSVTTGVAVATGSDSLTIVDQEAWVTSHGRDDDVAHNKQIVEVSHGGTAKADTGSNVAVGNVAAVEGSPAGVSASEGAAEIVTGTADAVGNWSTTIIGQYADATASGAGTAESMQFVTVTNVGSALASSGANLAVGSVAQGVGGPGDSSATGAASIQTGEAIAVGNYSDTDVTQVAYGEASGSAEVRIAQTSVVFNLGVAVATSGGNGALGNAVFEAVVPNAERIEELAVLLGVRPEFAATMWDDWGAELTSVIDGVAAMLGDLAQAPAGTLTITEALIGDPDDPDSPRVRVRQVVLILDYGIARPQRRQRRGRRGGRRCRP